MTKGYIFINWAPGQIMLPAKGSEKYYESEKLTGKQTKQIYKAKLP